MFSEVASTQRRYTARMYGKLLTSFAFLQIGDHAFFTPPQSDEDEDVSTMMPAGGHPSPSLIETPSKVEETAGIAATLNYGIKEGNPRYEEAIKARKLVSNRRMRVRVRVG